MAGSASTTAVGEQAVEDVLQHYGVKGMKWGVRKKEVVKTAVTVNETPGKRVTATGGTGQRASADARAAAKSRQKARASTVDALSNKELKALNERMNLEQNYRQLVSKDAESRKSKGRRMAEQIFSDVTGIGRRQANQAGEQYVSKKMKEMMNG